jgi:catechol-2,3-dioxygenase
MQITRLTLHTHDLLEQHRFYTETLGLTARFSQTNLEVQIGSSLLEFHPEAGFTGRYHFAFNIPRNQFAPAAAWLEARVSLIADARGQTRFHTDEWNADNLYFYDPAGNILELIARHELENDSDASFTAASLLEISEIGLAAPDAFELVTWFSEHLGIGTYKSFNDSFAPIGDAHGVVIAVKRARTWFPDTGLPAETLPTQITLRAQHPQSHDIPGLPYRIHLEPPRKEHP